MQNSLGKITIFRLTNTGDDSTTTDKIDFNIDVKTKIENAFITGIKLNPTDGIGNNQGAEQDLGDQQALGLLEDVIKISGHISKRNGDNNDGQNAFLILMDTWSAEPKINDNWQLGCYGMIDDDDHTEDVIPDESPNTVALLWERIEWDVDFKGNRKKFDLYFRVNRGDGT